MSSGSVRNVAEPQSANPIQLLKQATAAKERACDWMLDNQHLDGYWCGELEGDTILESEYVLLLAWMGKLDDPIVSECAEYIRQQQLPDGGWGLYPGAPLEISASVKSYWVLKMVGDAPDSEHMLRARTAILAAGGAEKVNSFTRYYLALLGIISYQQCPAVPPELVLLPNWFPVNIYKMSSWSRTIVVPLSLLWAFQPRTELPAEHKIDEIFVKSPEELSMTMPKAEVVDEISNWSWIPWEGFFNTVDRVWKGFEWCHLKPFRRQAVKSASKWMIRRFDQSDGLGAIFPPIIWSVIGLRCLGYDEDSDEVQTALNELKKLTIRERNTARLQPCKSPVWDTAIAVNALREADVPSTHPQLQKAVEWLLSKEVKSKGDWSVRHRKVEPAGWYFEFNNEFYPDIDDTIMVTMALARCLPGEKNTKWSQTFIKESPESGASDSELALVVAGKTTNPSQAYQELDRIEPILSAIRRAVKWVGAMQSRNGGWGAFDADNDMEILTKVPFADHNAMIDPPTADITARVLEMYGRLGMTEIEPMFARALEFVWNDQEQDDCWYGRWGVNYLYGTWQVLVGLTEFGVPTSDLRLQAAANWLKSKQQENGGWGETPRSYDEPHLRGTGPVTPSQTAWALLGLMAAGHVQSKAVERGIKYLVDTQNEDGSWDEPWYTGTGFPKVFYLRYHLYRQYFPLMALGRYQRLSEDS